jgi:hypothetical protein
MVVQNADYTTIRQPGRLRARSATSVPSTLTIVWIPGGVAETEDAIARGDLEETAAFDAKAALPASRKQKPSLVVDVAAMSTAGWRAALVLRHADFGDEPTWRATRSTRGSSPRS